MLILQQLLKVELESNVYALHNPKSLYPTAAVQVGNGLSTNKLSYQSKLGNTEG